jgi:peptidoglycan L-alanyl-D-glutamate endopeptidase CwlK
MKPYESRKIEDLHQTLQVAYLAAEQKFNEQHPDVNVIRTCTYRNNANARLVLQQATKDNQCKGRSIPHNYLPSFAFDIAFIRNRKVDYTPKYFKAFADIIKTVSNDIVWGGDWVRFIDAPHFELKDWRAKI